MLASRPRNDGLPKAPRSRSAGRARQDEPSNNFSREPSSRYKSSPSSHRAHAQRSIAFMSSAQDRSEPPPIFQSPQTSKAYNRSRAYESSSINRQESNASSSSTVSSNGSSLLDRLKRGGDASSRTSLEEDYGSLKNGRGHNSKAIEDSRQLYRGRVYEDDPVATAGAGYTIWSRLATAAGTLSVDVSKAWAVNVTLAAGEETPPGQESRLTQAMKAYHLEKARDPSDLPAWLFEEHERRTVGRPHFIDQWNDCRDEYEDTYEPVPRGRGLRDVYNSAAASPNSSSRTPGKPGRGIPNRFNDELAIPSKAADRLKALRDAKRQNNRFDEYPVKSNAHPDNWNRNEGIEISNTKLPARIRLPPSAPGRAQRY